MNIKVTMIMEDDIGGYALLKETFDDDDDATYEPELLANMAERLLRGYGYPEDIAHDIQSIGWSRLVKEKPAKGLKCLVSYKDGHMLKSDVDIWDGEKFEQYGDKVVFWACVPHHKVYWSNDPKPYKK